MSSVVTDDDDGIDTIVALTTAQCGTTRLDTEARLAAQLGLTDLVDDPPTLSQSAQLHPHASAHGSVMFHAETDEQDFLPWITIGDHHHGLPPPSALTPSLPERTIPTTHASPAAAHHNMHSKWTNDASGPRRRSTDLTSSPVIAVQ